jgi:pimeloyl-ACP methyl ester carboxylesterase
VDGPFALVGFSWGGNVGLRVARERLRALVLVDVGYQIPRGDPPRWEELLEEFSGADFASPEALAAGAEGSVLEPANEALENVRGIPVLLLAATVPYVERRAAELALFGERLPDADVHVVEGAEHNVLATAPDAALPVVRDFLLRHA